MEFVRRTVGEYPIWAQWRRTGGRYACTAAMQLAGITSEGITRFLLYERTKQTIYITNHFRVMPTLL